MPRLHQWLGVLRFPTASALTASAAAPLVQARGHCISTVPELLLVIADSAFTTMNKTRAAVELLKSVGAYQDVTRASKSRKIRAGKGKLRGRCHRQRRGPLVIINSADENAQSAVKSFRNIPGVETAPVTSLNLLQLAPGGYLGSFVVWTESAFNALNTVYGTTEGLLLPSNIVSNADIGRLINSAEVQAVVRPAKGGSRQKKGGKAGVLKKNPLKDRQVFLRNNPYTQAFSEQKLGCAKEEKVKERPGKTETFKTIINTD
ncbi:ribosomal protein L4 domain-containing protein [Tuber borchii]|uniref:Ribosomal protein L4 domain-containing protein n=1 Tax=Tuber borchii TaxID=42251 RepID=A0A2T6ZXG7_TUBBO|nr:ribosomal protein L4 domain-containing protein [Tuber borchii]